MACEQGAPRRLVGSQHVGRRSTSSSRSTAHSIETLASGCARRPPEGIGHRRRDWHPYEVTGAVPRSTPGGLPIVRETGLAYSEPGRFLWVKPASFLLGDHIKPRPGKLFVSSTQA